MVSHDPNVRSFWRKIRSVHVLIAYTYVQYSIHCEQCSSTIVIDFSDLDSDDMFEDPQSLINAAGMLNAIAEDVDKDVDKDDNCPTSPRLKKSKGSHTGAALYKCKYNAVWAREFPFIAPMPDDPYR